MLPSIGVAGLYDYGPAGCAIQANLINFWRKHFVLEEQMLEIDCSIMTPFDVLKTSGHVDRFTDYMVRDCKTGDFYRADHLIKHFFERKLTEKRSVQEKQEAENILAQVSLWFCLLFSRLTAMMQLPYNLLF